MNPIVAVLLVAYLLTCYVIPYYLVPHMRPKPLPARIPAHLKQAIAQIEKNSKHPHNHIKGCADYILSQNHSHRAGTLIHLPAAFEADANTLIKREGYMHGHHLTYLMRLMLAKSPFFTEADLRVRYTTLNGLIHPYLQARVAGQWYDIDLVGVSRGLSLGKVAWGIR
jgi:hypothetical protein